MYTISVDHCTPAALYKIATVQLFYKSFDSYPRYVQDILAILMNMQNMLNALHIYYAVPLHSIDNSIYSKIQKLALLSAPE